MDPGEASPEDQEKTEDEQNNEENANITPVHSEHQELITEIADNEEFSTQEGDTKSGEQEKLEGQNIEEIHSDNVVEPEVERVEPLPINENQDELNDTEKQIELPEETVGDSLGVAEESTAPPDTGEGAFEIEEENKPDEPTDEQEQITAVVTEQSENIMDEDNVQQTSVIQTDNVEITEVTPETVEDKLSEADKYENYETDSKHSRSKLQWALEFSEHEKTVTVIIKQNEDQSIAETFPIQKIIYEVKQVVADVLNINPTNIKLSMDGKEVDNCLSLAELKTESQQKIELELSVTDISNMRTKAEIPPFIPTTTTMTVKIEDPSGSISYLNVEVTNLSFFKVWCGGYKNTVTNTIYLNAQTQTRPLDRSWLYPPWETPPPLNTRQTQTHRPYMDFEMVTSANKATQMWRKDHYIPSVDDKIITPNKYICFEDYEAMRYPREKIILIQKLVRGWLARRHYKYALYRIKQKNLCILEAKRLRDQDREIELMKLVQAVSYPSSRADFYKLYTALSEWWKGQYQEIVMTKNGATRKAACYLLLLKEVELLFMIEKHRIKSKIESLRHRDILFLEKTSRPLVLQFPKHMLTIMDSLENQRAREFKEVYSSYVKTDLSASERIDVIMTLKHLLEGYEAYECLQELIGLLERECDLISLGVEWKYLYGLRKRIEEMLLNFLKQPEVNPQAETYSRPLAAKATTPKYLCHSCRKMLYPNYYLMHARMTRFWSCHACEWFRKIQNCINLIPYLRLLKRVRKSEISKCCHNSTCFILQAVGVHFIVNVIWDGKSAISQCSDIRLLRLPRWIEKEDWSPWNCIVLTEEEATIHENIKNVNEFYDFEFIEKVKTKHILTRCHFLELFNTHEDLIRTNAWENISFSEPYARKNAQSHIINLEKMNDPFFTPPPYKSFK